jgi:hypothetical protein
MKDSITLKTGNPMNTVSSARAVWMLFSRGGRAVAALFVALSLATGCVQEGPAAPSPAPAKQTGKEAHRDHEHDDHDHDDHDHDDDHEEHIHDDEHDHEHDDEHEHEHEHAHDHDHAHDHEHEHHHEGAVAIPAGVRENLGITFAKVERRAVTETRRVPGQFELLPTARQEYRALLPGRVEVKVEQFQRVAAGDLLFMLDAPQWRQLQHEAVEAEGDITVAQAALEVARAHRREAEAGLAMQQERLNNLAAVKVRKADLEADVAGIRSSLPRLDAQTRAAEAALREAREHYESRLTALASVTGLPVSQLIAHDGDHSAWRDIAVIEVRAREEGVIEELSATNGGWLEQGELAMSVVNPARIRFHAEAPQADIALFRDGMEAAIVPPQGDAIGNLEAMKGSLVLGPTVHPEARTLSLYVQPERIAPWARAGVAALLEVITAESPQRELAVPQAAIVQDGLERIVFRRDPDDPDVALRVSVALGADDGRWVVLRGGVEEGDEVVLNGAYALKLSGGKQAAPEGYHFHADGQLHKNH